MMEIDLLQKNVDAKLGDFYRGFMVNPISGMNPSFTQSSTVPKKEADNPTKGSWVLGWDSVFYYDPDYPVEKSRATTSAKEELPKKQA